jgi:cell wall-associated NlpC family hydrolase
MSLPLSLQRSIVAEARKWVGTPYLHGADIFGVGVDCCMILIRVYGDLNLIEKTDPRPYTTDWFLHRSDENYLSGVMSSADEVESPEPGDVILFRYGRCFSHSAIVTEMTPLTIVHAVMNYDCVVEEPLYSNIPLSTRMDTAKFFRVRGHA